MDNFNYQAYIKSGRIYGNKQEVISESQEAVETNPGSYVKYPCPVSFPTSMTSGPRLPE